MRLLRYIGSKGPNWKLNAATLKAIFFYFEQRFHTNELRVRLHDLGVTYHAKTK